MDALRALFRHHAWATLELIDHCASLSPERIEETAPGTYGTIRATLAHLVAADGRYLTRLGEPPPSPVRERDDPTLAEARAAFVAQVGRWQAVLAPGRQLDVTLPADGSWPELEHAEDLLISQAIHHGNDHRTQVGTILGALGLSTPDLDCWRFWALGQPAAS
jgi:uncharacterized damage-inducible protein DinB